MRQQPEDQARQTRWTPMRVALAFVLFTGIWAAGSDWLLFHTVADDQLRVWLGWVKNLLLLLVLGVVLFCSIRRMQDRLLHNQRLLQDKNHQLQALLEASPLAIVVTDPKGVVTIWNNAAERVFGWKRKEVIGQPNPIVPEGRWEEAQRLNQRVIEGGSFTGLEVRRQKKQGGTVDIGMSQAAILDASGQTAAIVAVMADISDKKRQEQRVYHMATHDPLTNLPNRRLFEENLGRIMQRAQNGESAAVLMMDLDSFKLVNDAHGHVEGDRYLVNLARRLRQALPPGHLLARFGGDEFVVLMEDTDDQQAQSVAEQLRDLVRSYAVERQGRRYSATVSIGGCVIDGSLQAKSVMVLADTALLAAKDAGRNRVVLYNAQDQQRSALGEASRWANRIKEAMNERRLELHFQPIVKLDDQSPHFHEVLVRMRSRSGELIRPGEFLGAAERFGLIYEIDRWVMQAALDRLKSEPNLRLFVNLSGSSLIEDELLGIIEKRMNGDGIGPDRLVVEITETAAVRDFAKAERWMSRLKQSGVRFALDDFGIGYASFSCVRTLPIDFIKIDGSFIRNLHEDHANLAWVRAMAAVGQSLGKQIVAEWIETAEVAKLVHEMGIEFGQGHYWRKPEATPVAPDTDWGRSEPQLQTTNHDG